MKFVLQSVAAKTLPVLFGINRFFKWYNTLSLANRILLLNSDDFERYVGKHFIYWSIEQLNYN